MFKTKVSTTTALDVPPGYIYLEDKVAQVQRLSQIQLQRKEAGITDYAVESASEELQVALLKACKEELDAMQAIVRGED